MDFGELFCLLKLCEMNNVHWSIFSFESSNQTKLVYLFRDVFSIFSQDSAPDKDLAGCWR